MWLMGIAHISGCRVEIARDDIPSDTTLGEMVDGGQPARQMVRRLICCCDRHAKAEILRGRSHGRDDGERLIDGPLSTRDDGRVQVARAFVDIIATYRAQ